MLLQNIRKRIDAKRLLEPKETILVAVSGGIDSVVLLHILWKLNQQYAYQWKLHVFHLNHGFRGEESRQDAVFVGEFCEQLGIDYDLIERDVSIYMKEQKLGTQEAAREVRYQLLEELATRIKATKVAIAHHADDQVETILFRLLRGTNVGGLAGMPERRWLIPEQTEIVRPLLSTYRKELEEYCQEHHIRFREDSSNQSTKYTRNRLRLDVLPLLESINPRYKDHILQLSEGIQLDDHYLRQLSKDQLEHVIVSKELNKLVISREKLLKCDLALQRRMITLILSYLSNESEWSSQHVEAVFRILHNDSPSGIVHLPKQLVVRRNYEYIFFGKKEIGIPAQDYSYELAIPGTTWIPETGVALHVSWLTSGVEWATLPANCAVFDGDLLSEKLVVRNRRAGDRMSLLGASVHKKVKDIFIDAKVPKDMRERLPVVVAGTEIIWIPTVKRSSVASVTELTCRFIHMEVEFGEDWREVTNE